MIRFINILKNFSLIIVFFLILLSAQYIKAQSCENIFSVETEFDYSEIRTYTENLQHRWEGNKLSLYRQYSTSEAVEGFLEFSVDDNVTSYYSGRTLKTLYIGNLYVSRSMRERGVARWLLKMVLKKFPGIQRITGELRGANYQSYIGNGPALSRIKYTPAYKLRNYFNFTEIESINADGELDIESFSMILPD